MVKRKHLDKIEKETTTFMYQEINRLVTRVSQMSAQHGDRAAIVQQLCLLITTITKTGRCGVKMIPVPDD